MMASYCYGTAVYVAYVSWFGVEQVAGSVVGPGESSPPTTPVDTVVAAYCAGSRTAAFQYWCLAYVQASYYLIKQMSGGPAAKRVGSEWYWAGNAVGYSYQAWSPGGDYMYYVANGLLAPEEVYLVVVNTYTCQSYNMKTLTGGEYLMVT